MSAVAIRLNKDLCQDTARSAETVARRDAGRRLTETSLGVPG